MVLIYQYSELYESESISSFWKGLQILLYVVCSLTSFGASFSFGYVYNNYWDKNCILYSSVTFVKDARIINPATQNSAENNVTTLDVPFGKIDVLKTIWARNKTCDFCLYAILFSFIACFLWATFFTMCGRGGKAIGGLPAPWRIVFPALVFNVIYFVISIVALVYMEKGLAIFCNNFITNMEEDSCQKLEEYDETYEKRATLFLHLSRIFAWATASLWMLSIVSLILRCMCVPDFELYKIKIQTPITTLRKSSGVPNAENATIGSTSNNQMSLMSDERQRHFGRDEKMEENIAHSSKGRQPVSSIASAEESAKHIAKKKHST